MNQLMEVSSNPSTDWTREVQELVEARDFALWTKEIGQIALADVEIDATDSVRITAQDDSVRITMNRDF